MVELSSITSRCDTLAASQPNRSLATAAAMRAFSSNFRRTASAELISVFTSMTNSVRVEACQARMSMEPDAPRNA